MKELLIEAIKEWDYKMMKPKLIFTHQELINPQLPQQKILNCHNKIAK